MTLIRRCSSVRAVSDTFAISVSHCGSVATVVVVGELDAVTAATLDWRLRVVRGSRASIVVLDLSRVMRIDRAALQPILDAREVLGERLRVIACANVLQLFTLAGVLDAELAGLVVPARFETRGAEGSRSPVVRNGGRYHARDPGSRAGAHTRAKRL